MKFELQIVCEQLETLFSNFLKIKKNLHDVVSIKNMNMHNVIKWNTILKNKHHYSYWTTFRINWPRYLVFLPKFLLRYCLLKMVVVTFNEDLITMISISLYWNHMSSLIKASTIEIKIIIKTILTYKRLTISYGSFFPQF